MQCFGIGPPAVFTGQAIGDKPDGWSVVGICDDLCVHAYILLTFYNIHYHKSFYHVLACITSMCQHCNGAATAGTLWNATENKRPNGTNQSSKNFERTLSVTDAGFKNAMDDKTHRLPPPRASWGFLTRFRRIVAASLEHAFGWRCRRLVRRLYGRVRWRWCSLKMWSAYWGVRLCGRLCGWGGAPRWDDPSLPIYISLRKSPARPLPMPDTINFFGVLLPPLKNKSPSLPSKGRTLFYSIVHCTGDAPHISHLMRPAPKISR